MISARIVLGFLFMYMIHFEICSLCLMGFFPFTHDVKNRKYNDSRYKQARIIYAE